MTTPNHAKTARQRAEARFGHPKGGAPRAFRGGSNPDSKSFGKPFISKYLYSLLDAEALNVAHPALGPYPYRTFQLKTVIYFNTNSSKEVFFQIDPTQLGPVTENSSGAGFLTVEKGTCLSPIDGATLIGEGQVNDTAGPYLAGGVTSRACTAFLNSCEVVVNYVGSTLNDGGTLRMALVPQIDATSTVSAPVFGNVQDQPLGQSVPIRDGISMPWLPLAWDCPMRVRVGDTYFNRVAASGPGTPSSSTFTVAATSSDVTSAQLLEVIVYQNFTFATNDIWFAGGGNYGVAASHSALQHRIEQRAVNEWVAREPHSLATKPERKHRRSRLKSIGKFLKKAWGVADPILRAAWNNRGLLPRIGNWLPEITPSQLPELPASAGPIIEEVEEGAELAPLLLTL